MSNTERFIGVQRRPFVNNPSRTLEMLDVSDIKAPNRSKSTSAEGF